MKKICTICLAEYYTESKSSLTCSKQCQRERTKILKRWKKKSEKFIPPKVEPETVTDIAIKARMLGLSYGQYVARQNGGIR